jgi:hypothetical protein
MIANPPTSQIWEKSKKNIVGDMFSKYDKFTKNNSSNLTTLVHFFHQKILCTSQTGFFWSPSDKNLPKQMSSDV